MNWWTITCLCWGAASLLALLWFAAACGGEEPKPPPREAWVPC